MRAKGFCDEWIFIKLYAEPSTLDRVLVSIIGVVIAEARHQHLLASWFFVRYSDPDNHLRVRLRASSKSRVFALKALLDTHLKPAVNSKELWKIQTDIYSPEYERYGGARGMQIAERFFEIDSDAALAVTSLSLQNYNDDLQWQGALLAMDQTIRALYPTHAERLVFTKQVRDAYAKDSRWSGRSLSALGLRTLFQEHGALHFIDDPNKPVHPSSETVLFDVAAAHKRSVLPVVTDFVSDRDRVSVGKDSFTTSVLHMLVNRFLRSDQNLHEVMLYGLLWRLYEKERYVKHVADKSRDVP